MQSRSSTGTLFRHKCSHANTFPSIAIELDKGGPRTPFNKLLLILSLQCRIGIILVEQSYTNASIILRIMLLLYSAYA